MRTPWGRVSARHSRGAPFIQSAPSSGAQVGDSYLDFETALRGSSSAAVADPQIAADLLDETSTFLTTPEQQLSAAKLKTTVELAEDWRKKGAAKLHRAQLRRVRKGNLSLRQAHQGFAFVRSADAGRQQVGRIQDVAENRTPLTDLPPDEQELYQELSPVGPDDFSSDSDLRRRKALKKNRLYSKKHAGTAASSSSSSSSSAAAAASSSSVARPKRKRGQARLSDSDDESVDLAARRRERLKRRKLLEERRAKRAADDADTAMAAGPGPGRGRGRGRGRGGRGGRGRGAGRGRGRVKKGSDSDEDS